MKLLTWKKLAVGGLVVAVAFVVLARILGIEETRYHRWSNANWLQNLHRGWLRAGAPLPADPNNYGSINIGTTYVYTASHVIGGSNYYGLFAYEGEEHFPPPNHFAVATNGAILVLDDPAGVRLLHFSKRGAGAW
jgi:hypothetical protein